MSEGMETTALTESIEVQNVVGSADLGRELDLAAVAMDLSETKYDPEKMPGLVYRPPAAEATVMVFESGKAMVMGAASGDDARKAFGECVADLRSLGISLADLSEIDIENIVARADFGEEFHLSAVAVGLGLEQVEYEPEQFPGLVYRLDTPEAVVLLFGSGKAVIVGATKRVGIETAVERVATRLADLGLLEE